MDYLVHWGIKGMRWGIRRFQNPDGTRTEAGKRRERQRAQDMSDDDLKREVHRMNMEKQYDKLSRGRSKSESIQNVQTGINAAQRSIDDVRRSRRQDADAEAYATAKEKAKTMSDADLQKAVNRMNLERQYANLSKEEVATGKQTVDVILAYSSIALGLVGGGLAIAKTVYDFKK